MMPMNSSEVTFAVSLEFLSWCTFELVQLYSGNKFHTYLRRARIIATGQGKLSRGHADGTNKVYQAHDDTETPKDDRSVVWGGETNVSKMNIVESSNDETCLYLWKKSRIKMETIWTMI